MSEADQVTLGRKYVLMSQCLNVWMSEADQATLGRKRVNVSKSECLRQIKLPLERNKIASFYKHTAETIQEFIRSHPLYCITHETTVEKWGLNTDRNDSLTNRNASQGQRPMRIGSLWLKLSGHLRSEVAWDSLWLKVKLKASKKGGGVEEKPCCHSFSIVL